MTEQILFFAHYALLLLFGIFLSAAFAGILPTGKNLIRLGLTTVLCAILQIILLVFFGEETVWQLYPFVTHLPTVLLLWRVLGRAFPISVVATASAYLCCQPAKWFGIAAFTHTGSLQTELLVRIFVLAISFAVILRWFAEKIARIYSNRQSGSWVFGITPVVYYLFDYAVAIYSSLWTDQHQLVMEFLPFFLCIGQLLFCSVYYREFELKNEAERKEQFLRITLEQQAKEVETIRRSEAGIRVLRHDFRLLLNSLAACIRESDLETAQKLISGFSNQTEVSSIKRYCANDTLNYVLSDYAAQCRERNVSFHPVIELAELNTDEILFCSILANALDNALNAQAMLPPDRRSIRLMLKNSDGKILLCVKNSFSEPPSFRDGLPVTSRRGHGTGAQSIRYATEKLGGNCRFSVEEDCFMLQVVI